MDSNKIREGMKLIFEGINHFSYETQVKEIIDGICTEHRTLQQNFWRAIFRCMEEYAKYCLEYKRFDDRNHDSVLNCEAAAKLIKENGFNYFPTI